MVHSLPLRVPIAFRGATVQTVGAISIGNVIMDGTGGVFR